MKNPNQASTSTWIEMSLDETLENRAHFDAFHRWLIRADLNSETEFNAETCYGVRKLDALEVYLAIRAFHRCVREHDTKTKQMAMALHRKYISPRTGTCNFIRMEIRREISAQVHFLAKNNARTEEIRGDLFDKALNCIWEFLSQQHALFVCSQNMTEQQTKKSIIHLSKSTEMIVNGSNDFEDVHASAEWTVDATAPQRLYSSMSTNFSTQSGFFAPPIGGGSVTTRVPRLENIQENEWIPMKSGSFDGQLPTSIHRSGLTSGLIYINKKNNNNNNIGVGRVRSRTKSEPPTQHEFRNTIWRRFPGISGESIRERSESAKFDHELEEDRFRFAEAISTRLNELLSRIRELEISTEQEIYSRDLYARNSLDSWDEDDTIPPEFIFNIMRSSFIATDSRRIPMTGCPQNYAPPSSSASFHNKIIPTAASSSSNSGAVTRCSAPCLKQLNAASGCYSDSSGFSSTDSAYWQTLNGQISHSTTGIMRMSDEPSLLFISYKESGGVPFVVKIPHCEVTFRDFRNQFGISSKTNKRFLFKSVCEDESAPFQWTVANEDRMILPVFEGRITAKCRTISPPTG